MLVYSTTVTLTVTVAVWIVVFVFKLLFEAIRSFDTLKLLKVRVKRVSFIKAFKDSEPKLLLLTA